MLSLAGLKHAVPHRYRYAARQAFLRVAAVTNAGSGVECPCCGRRFRKFARFYGANDQCPGCGALMRHRALQLLLLDRLGVATIAGDIVDVAPDGSVGRRLAALPGANYVSVDLDSPLADVHADIVDLPFADASFDLALCLHVLEHIADDRAAIRQLYRILRPGGTAVIQVPPSQLAVTFEDAAATTPEQRRRAFGQFDHVRICGADYAGRLEEAGFEVTLEDYVARLPHDTRRRYGLRLGEPFYLCVRPAAA
jgi:SAM-dependent methyltransferase